MLTPTTLYLVPLIITMIGWICFGSMFIFRIRSQTDAVRSKDRASLIGVVMVIAGFSVVWSMGRRPFTPILPMNIAAWSVMGGVAILLVPASLWLMWSAVRVLGKQWSAQARVLESHELVTSGPYRFVRHPIYTAILGMEIAAGIVYSSFVGLLLGVALIAVGTYIRIQREERLLRQQFGEAYERYAGEVGAILPLRLRSRSSS